MTIDDKEREALNLEYSDLFRGLNDLQYKDKWDADDRQIQATNVFRMREIERILSPQPEKVEEDKKMDLGPTLAETLVHIRQVFGKKHEEI